jgi:hypothetical protein
MKTINLKSAFVTATVIAFLTLTSNVANAQWKSDRDDRDKTLREKIEEKLERERRSKEDNRWDRRDDNRYDRRDDNRYDRRDVKYNNGRFNKNNRYDRNDCCQN